MIYYTVTIVTMDGSDTNAYGEPCEPGQGYTEHTGWLSIRSGSRTVRPSREQVEPDIYPASGQSTPARWLVDRLTDRIGPVQGFEGEASFYGAETVMAAPDALDDLDVADDEPDYLGSAGTIFMTAAGHAQGFTRREILEAAHLLGLAPAPAVHDRHGVRSVPRGFVAPSAVSSDPTAARARTGAPDPDREPLPDGVAGYPIGQRTAKPFLPLSTVDAPRSADVDTPASAHAAGHQHPSFVDPSPRRPR